MTVGSGVVLTLGKNIMGLLIGASKGLELNVGNGLGSIVGHFRDGGEYMRPFDPKPIRQKITDIAADGDAKGEYCEKKVGVDGIDSSVGW